MDSTKFRHHRGVEDEPTLMVRGVDEGVSRILVDDELLVQVAS
jgi:hypothetical protein